MPCAFDKDCDVRGYAMERALVVCEALKLNCTFGWYNGTEYGDYDEKAGKVAGLLGAIYDGVFDSALPVLTPTYRRAKALAFSDSYVYAMLLIGTRAPDMENGESDLSALLAFQWPVWCALLVALLLTTAVMTIGSRILRRSRSSVPKLFVDELFTLAIPNDHSDRDIQQQSLRLVAGFWALASIVVVTLSTGLLCSLNIGGSVELPFTDLESFVDCLAEDRCRMIAPSKSFSFLQLLTSTENLGSRVLDAIKRHPIEISPEEEIPKRILQEKDHFLVWPGSSTTLLYHIRKYGDCDFHIVEAPYKVFGAFPLRKNSTWLPLLNGLAAPFHESGLGTVIHAKYEKRSVCSGFRKKDTFVRFASLRTLFLWYGCGILASAAVLVGEMIAGAVHAGRILMIR